MYILQFMKITVAIIMGGYSSEVNISMKSGNVVYQHLNRDIYRPFRVHILKNEWVALDEDGATYSIDKSDFSFTAKDEKVNFDCIFNAIHGAPGEDGSLVAYFETLGMRHTSAPFYQMALTFNKRDTLSVVKQYGIKTAKSVYLNEGDEILQNDIVEKVGLPCFVKPNKAGSSFGISKVYEQQNLLAAIQKAFSEDSEILIEGFLEGIEVSVGVIQYAGQIKVLPITEIVSDNDFFDYEAKYEGKSQEITPARLSEETKLRVEEEARKVYQILQMSGFSRSEFILVNDEPHFLEMNTVPGLTEESILPQQANEAGISLASLFDNAIKMALKS